MARVRPIAGSGRSVERRELMRRKPVSAVAFAALVVSVVMLGMAGAHGNDNQSMTEADRSRTATPVKHLVVIFDENIAFDHYFATYPDAANPPGEPKFNPLPHTPLVNGLSGPLLTNNSNRVNPFRLHRSQAPPYPTNPLACENNHMYAQLEAARDSGLLDKF